MKLILKTNVSLIYEKTRGNEKIIGEMETKKKISWKLFKKIYRSTSEWEK